MFSKIFCLFLITLELSCGENIFQNVYESQEGCRVTVCAMNSERACRAVAWSPDWVLAQAPCVLHFPVSAMAVKRGVANCSRDAPAMGEQGSRAVLALHHHPQHPDLALLQLNWPYDFPQSIFHGNTSSDIIYRLDDWMKSVLFSQSEHMMKTAGYKTYKMYSTPIRMFLLTVVLPSASFIVFFLFIIFFTGKNKSGKIPYRNLKNEKRETTYV